MKELLEALARELVTEPRRVSVEEYVEDGVTCLSLRVGRDDRGRVIGRNGRTAEALRILVEDVAEKHGIRCEVDVE